MNKNKKLDVSMGADVDPSKYVPPDISVTVGSNDQSIFRRNNLIGKIISINLKKETYFGIGDIWLSPENYWATVPDRFTDEAYEIIAKSLALGFIVLGKQFIPPVDKISNTLEKYWSFIDKTGFESKQAKAEFSSLARKGIDSGWTAVEIAQFCINKENKGKKRKEVLKLLTQLIQNYRGPIQLYDPPDSGEGLKKVIIKADGTIEAETNSGKKVAKRIESQPPKGHIKGGKTADQAINDIV
jgi:hypothetical protein